MSLLIIIALVAGEPLYGAWQRLPPAHGPIFSACRLLRHRVPVSGFVGLCLAAGAHRIHRTVLHDQQRFGVWAHQACNIPIPRRLCLDLPPDHQNLPPQRELLFRLFAVPWLLRLTRSKALAVVAAGSGLGLPARQLSAGAGLDSRRRSGRHRHRGRTGDAALGHPGHAGVALHRGRLPGRPFADALGGFLQPRYPAPSWAWAAVIAVAIAGVLYLKRGSFAESSALLNRAEPLIGTSRRPRPAAPSRRVPAPSYAPAEYARRFAILRCTPVAGVTLMLAGRTPPIGDFVRFSLDSGEAQTRAAEVLRSRASTRTVTTARPLSRTASIRWQRISARSIGIAAANKVYQTQAPAAYWTIRFFRDSEKEEYLVVLRPDGAPHSVHHTLPEEAPGANLSKEAAQQRAEAYLLQARMLDLAQWTLVDSQSDKLPARTDHSFTWEQNAAVASLGGDEGAHVRMDVRVQGDEPSGYRVYIHLPEQWAPPAQPGNAGRPPRTPTPCLASSEHSSSRSWSHSCEISKQPSAAAVPWRKLARWTLPVLAAFVVWVFTNIPQYLAAYPTENSLTTYLGMTGVSFVLGSRPFIASSLCLFGLGCVLPGAGPRL